MWVSGWCMCLFACVDACSYGFMHIRVCLHGCEHVCTHNCAFVLSTWSHVFVLVHQNWQAKCTFRLNTKYKVDHTRRFVCFKFTPSPYVVAVQEALSIKINAATAYNVHSLIISIRKCANKATVFLFHVVVLFKLIRTVHPFMNFFCSFYICQVVRYLYTNPTEQSVTGDASTVLAQLNRVLFAFLWSI